MSTAVLFEDELLIPAIASLEEFRRWMRSDEFPQRGRIDYINGQIEVDMSPENLFFHGTVKGRIYATLLDMVEAQGLGYLFCDCTRVTCVAGGVSAEPDIVLLSDDAIDTGRVKLIPKAGGEEEGYIEIEGPPELIVEVVSDSSVRKATKRLPPAFFAGGVAEYWLVDARRTDLKFTIHTRGEDGFLPVPVDGEGFQRSPVLGARFQLEKKLNTRGRPIYVLHVEP